MKHLSILALAIFVFCSCQSNVDIFDFEGEYIVSTIVEVVYDGDKENYVYPEPFISNLEIYKDSIGVKVQTDYFGLPDYKHILNQAVLSPYGAPTRSMYELENLTNIILANGLVHCLYNGVEWRSLPINVVSSRENRLKLMDSSNFEIKLTNVSGEPIDTVDCHFEYEDIIKGADEMTWNAHFIQKFRGGKQINYPNYLKGVNYRSTITRRQ